jgi:SM-20-related protein
MELADIAVQLGATGRCVVPDFLSAATQDDARRDLDESMRAGRFSAAGTGAGAQHGVRENVRSDQVYWPPQSDANQVQSQLWAHTAALMQAFNRTLYLGLTRFEGHYASYAQGGFYRRHRDSFAHNDQRMVSLILYLNADWKIQDGGELRLHDLSSHVDVAPRGGTLVCFLSQEVEHEVLQCHAQRRTFTGWFKRGFQIT